MRPMAIPTAPPTLAFLTEGMPRLYDTWIPRQVRQSRNNITLVDLCQRQPPHTAAPVPVLSIYVAAIADGFPKPRPRGLRCRRLRPGIARYSAARTPGGHRENLRCKEPVDSRSIRPQRRRSQFGALALRLDPK